MDRKVLNEPDWAGDEESEVALDARAAERYGFELTEITAARHDLIAFESTFHDNAFAEYEEFHKKLGNSVRRLRKSIAEISSSSRYLDVGEINKICSDLSVNADRLQNVSALLPRRPHSLEKIAAIYLIAFWTHVERRPDYEGTRDVVLSFDVHSRPIHCSACFIVDMLKRSKGVLKGVSISTIKRAKAELGSTIPHPREVYAFKGDVELLSI